MVISFENCEGAFVGGDITIKNAPVGITSVNSKFSAEGVKFENVGQPYKISGSEQTTIKGSRITKDPKRGSSSGWQKLDGPPLPAFCPQCKTTFVSANYRWAGRYFELWDNEETCPNPLCRNEHAKLSEGIFDLTLDVARILSAPDFTFSMLQALQVVARDFEANLIDINQACDKIVGVSPSFDDVLSRSKGFLYSASMLIFTAVAAVVPVYDHIHSTASKEAAAQQVASVTFVNLGNLFINTSNSSEKNVAESHRSAATTPSKSEPTSRKITPKVVAKIKPKARNTARRAGRERRKALRGCEPHKKP